MSSRNKVILVFLLITFSVIMWMVRDVSVTVATGTNHVHGNYTAVVTDPTCTEDGYTTYTCGKSGCTDPKYSYTGNTVEATGHSWGEWEAYIVPTCIAKGWNIRYCDNCDEEDWQELAKDPNNHSWVQYYGKTSEGNYITSTDWTENCTSEQHFKECSRCKKTKDVGYHTIDPEGHLCAGGCGKWMYNIESSSCTHHVFPNGCDFKCTLCDDALLETEIIYSSDLFDQDEYHMADMGCNEANGCIPLKTVKVKFSHYPWKSETEVWDENPCLFLSSYEHGNWEAHAKIYEDNMEYQWATDLSGAGVDTYDEVAMWASEELKFTVRPQDAFYTWWPAGGNGWDAWMYGDEITLEEPTGGPQEWVFDVSNLSGHFLLEYIWHLPSKDGVYDDDGGGIYKIFCNNGEPDKEYTNLKRVAVLTNKTDTVIMKIEDYELVPLDPIRYNCPAFTDTVTSAEDTLKAKHYRFVAWSFSYTADHNQTPQYYSKSGSKVLKRWTTNTFCYFFEYMPTIHVYFKTVGGEDLTGISYNDVTMSGWQDPSGGNSWYLENYPDKDFEWSLKGKLNLDTHYRFKRTEISDEGDAWTTGVATSGTPQEGDARFSGTVTVNPYKERTIIFIYEKMPEIHIVYRDKDGGHPEGTPADDTDPAIVYIEDDENGNPKTTYGWELKASLILEKIHYRYAGVNITRDGKSFMKTPGSPDCTYPPKDTAQSGTITKIASEESITITFVYERMPTLYVVYRDKQGNSIEGAPEDVTLYKKTPGENTFVTGTGEEDITQATVNLTDIHYRYVRTEVSDERDSWVGPENSGTSIGIKVDPSVTVNPNKERTVIFVFEKMPTIHTVYRTTDGDHPEGTPADDTDPEIIYVGDKADGTPITEYTVYCSSSAPDNLDDIHYRFSGANASRNGHCWETGIVPNITYLPETSEHSYTLKDIKGEEEITVTFLYEKMPTIHIVYRTTHYQHVPGAPEDDADPAIIYLKYGEDKYKWTLGADVNLDQDHYRYLGETTSKPYKCWQGINGTGANFQNPENYHIKEETITGIKGEEERTIIFIYERMPEVIVAYRGARGETISGAPADHHEWLKYDEEKYNWNMSGSSISPSGRALNVNEPDVDLRDDSKYRYRGERDLGPQSCFNENTYTATALPGGALEGSWYDIEYNFLHSGSISPKGDEDAWVVLIYEKDPIVNVIYRDRAGNPINIEGAVEDISPDYAKKIYLTATPGSGYLNTYTWSTDETVDEHAAFFNDGPRKEPNMLPYNKAKYRYLGEKDYDDLNTSLAGTNDGFKNISGMSFGEGVGNSYKDKKDAAGNPLHDGEHHGTITVKPYHEGYVVFVFDIMPKVEIAYRDNEGKVIPGTGKIEDHPIENIRLIELYDDEYKYDGYNLSYDITKGVQLLDTFGWRYNGHMWDAGSTLDAGNEAYKNIGNVGTLDNKADKTAFKAGHSTDASTGGTYGTRLIQLGEYTHATLDPEDKTTDAHLTYVFEPILLTVMHYVNTTQQNVLTQLNLTMRMPKINEAGHTDSSLGCSPLEEGNEITHVIRSLNKNAWPGYMLTNYYLGEKAVNYPSNNTYGIAGSKNLFDTGRTKDQIRTELSNILLEEAAYDATTTTKVDMSEGGRENAIKEVKIKTSAHAKQAGEQVGRRPDLKIVFIYEQIIIIENHLKSTDGSFLKSNREPNQGLDLTKRKVIADNYFTSDSLVLRGDNILTNEGTQMGYNYDGWILKDIRVKPETKGEVSVWAWVVGDDVAAANIDEEIAKRLFCQVRGTYIAQAGGGFIENNTKVNFYYEQKRDEDVIKVRHVHERDRRDLLPMVETGFAPGQTAMTLRKSDIIPYDYLYVEIDETTLNDSPEITITPAQKIKTVTFVYGDKLPKINVEYRLGTPDGEQLFDPEVKQFLRQTINIPNTHPNGKTAEDGTKIDYSYYVLYEGDNVLSGETDTGTDIEVKGIRNNGNVRLLVFVFGSPELPPPPTITNPTPVSGDEINVDFTDILLRSTEGKYSDKTKEEYNVDDAIPTSEDLYANVITDTYLVKEVNNVHLMKKRFHVNVIKQYTETNDSEKDKQGGTDITSMGDDKILQTSEKFDIDVPYYYNSGRDTIFSLIDHADVHNEVIEWHEDRDTTEILPYSDKNIPWTVESNGIVKGHVRLFPKGPQPDMEFTLGGKLKIKPSYTTVAETANAEGVLQPGIYDIIEEADGSYTITYVMGSFGYNLKQTKVDIEKQIQDFKDNPWSLTEQLVKTGTRVESDSLVIKRENGSKFIVWQGDLPLTMTGYTINGIEEVEAKEGTTVLQIPTKSVLNENILYKDNNLYVNKEKANGTYATSGDVIYREMKYIDSGDFMVKDIENGQLSTLNSKSDIPGNDVKVHTPVGNESQLIAGNFENQSFTLIKEIESKDANKNGKEDFHYLRLDSTFTIKIPYGVEGATHKFDYTGYVSSKLNTNTGYKKGTKDKDKNPEVGGALTTWGTIKDVKVPFDVYVKDTRNNGNKLYIPAGTWLSQGVYNALNKNASAAIEFLEKAEKVSDNATVYEFTIPVWVDETDYKIETRVIAENAFNVNETTHMPVIYNGDGTLSLKADRADNANTKNNQRYSNKERANYVATNQHTVRVIGYIYDLEVISSTDIDWSRLNGSLGAGVGGSVTTIGSASFPFGLTGGKIGSEQIPSQNANTAYKNSPKLGYTFAFSFKTKGRKSNQVIMDLAHQGFEFIAKTGKETEAEVVDLYYKPSNQGKYVKIGSPEDHSSITVIPNAPFMRVNSVEMTNSTRIYPIEKLSPLVPDNVPYIYSLPVKIGTLTQLVLPHRLRFTYDNFANYIGNKDYYGSNATKEAIANFAAMDPNEKWEIYNGGKVTGESGVDKVIGSIGHWYGAYNLPGSTIAVVKGQDPNLHPEYIKKNGYIIIHLGLYTEHATYKPDGTVDNKYAYLVYTGPNDEFKAYVDENKEWPLVTPEKDPEPEPTPDDPEPAETPIEPGNPGPGAGVGGTVVVLGSTWPTLDILQNAGNKGNGVGANNNNMEGKAIKIVGKAASYNNNIVADSADQIEAAYKNGLKKEDSAFYKHVVFPDGTTGYVRNSALAVYDADKSVQDDKVGTINF